MMTTADEERMLNRKYFSKDEYSCSRPIQPVAVVVVKQTMRVTR